MIPAYDLISAGFLIQNRKVFVAQRSENDDNPLKWEFPGGKLNVDEHYDAALIREFKEEFDIDIEVLQEIGSAEVEDNKKILMITFLLISGDASKIKLNVHKETRFVNLAELKSLDLCNADRDFINNFEPEIKNLID